MKRAMAETQGSVPAAAQRACASASTLAGSTVRSTATPAWASLSA